MVKAAKDSYRRVYKSDGKFHYPKVAANLLRKKGEEYFKPVELRGSSEGSEKQPKMSLLQQYYDHIIPDLEQKVVEKFNENGNKKVCVVFQEDGAEFHTDAAYFAGKRFFLLTGTGWSSTSHPSLPL